ncbi:VOC family protein [Spongiivirga sp. MCCC 1A20706]|uniref:VOC family protein n=1 Tax=Spongiivirga sp. MCCC 1A20706 TaxID=3160963 RepID=UPI003977CD0E
MNEIFNTYRPEGFHTVNSYLFTADPLELIDFLKHVFYAEEIGRSLHPKSGVISNCILKIGDSCIMISQATESFLNMRTALYLYVDDVDEIHDRAVSHGAKVEFMPADMDYGDRQSGIIDPAGNYWWISKRLVEKGYHD